MKVETYQIAAHDWVPNNDRLPVIVYRAACLSGGCDETASAFEAIFAEHGWPARWRGEVYDYHHYHSTAHEVLGVAAGSARLVIGGPGGRELAVAAGDALLLPVGTGHCALESSADFLVVGGYPEGQDRDICRTAPDADALSRMAALPFPQSDPVAGSAGPSTQHWRSPIR